MCGINIDNTNKLLKSGALKRGPDATSEICFDGIRFTHSRLAITDGGENGLQPIVNQDFIFLFNGEIYNWKEIGLQYNIDATGDTNLLWIALNKGLLYQVLSLAYGPFAIVWYEKHKKTLNFVRDYLGEKPLYCRVSGDEVSISSVLRDFKKLTVKSRQNTQEILMYGFAFDDKTIYESVFSCKPGYVYQKEITGNLKIEKLPETSRPEFDINSLNHNVNLIQKADLSSSVLLLSDGMDSNYIDQHIDAKTKRLTLEYTNKKTSLIQTRENYFIYEKNIDEMADVFGDYLACNESCNADPAGMNIWILSKLVRAEFDAKVMITGDGADEIFGSYPRLRVVRKLPAPYNQRFAKTLSIRSRKRMCLELLKDLKHLPWLDKKDLWDFDVNQRLSNYLNVKLDSNTLQNGVEARTPFLDPGFFNRKSLSLNFCKHTPAKQPLIQNMRAYQSGKYVKKGFALDFGFLEKFLSKNSKIKDQAFNVLKSYKLPSTHLNLYRAVIVCSF